MNSRAKGRRIENLAKKKLESEGWSVIQVSGSTKFKKQVDFFGLFDLIAMKPDRASRIRFIQVKANKLPTKKQWNKLNEFRYHCYKEIACDGFFQSAHSIQIGEVEWWCYWNRGKRKNKQGWEVIII